MSDTILSGRWAVYYESESRQKRVKRDTSVTPTVTDTVQQLYSALMNLFDESLPASESTPMKFDTPVQYKIGIIDAGDKDPWFVDRTSVEYLTGGSLETVGWARVVASNTGIVTVACSGAFGILETDIGMAISHGDGDTGTLLDVKTTTKELVIRPADFTAPNNWDSAAGTITCNAHTTTQNAAATTGDQLWANIYTTGLATLQPNTTLAVFQAGAFLTRYKDTIDWWNFGDVDILVPIKTSAGALIDAGYLTIQARRALTTYYTFIAGVAAGGRNPIPLTCKADLNNTDGNRQMILTTASGNFTLGEIIRDDDDATVQGVVTSNAGTAPNITVQYYLIGDPQTDFSVATGAFTGLTSTTTATAVNPSDVNAGAVAGCTIVHGVVETFDVNEDGTTENYSVVIDCNNYPLADVYTWTQYITRIGATATGNTDGVQGQQYIGSDYRIVYVTLTGSLSDGDVVTQQNTLATGTVVGHNTTDKYLILRNSRGTFNNVDEVRKDVGNKVATPTSTAITPFLDAPFGFFAGGKWFLAPGCVLSNVPTADVNNYQLTDDQGNTVSVPLKVTTTVGNTRLGDWVAVFELTAVGGVIKKDAYLVDAAMGGAGATIVKVDPSIASKVVGKVTGGILRLVKASNGHEYRYRYTVWATDEFTLFNLAGSTATGGSQTTLTDAGVDFLVAGVVRGDIVRNVTESAYAYVVSVAQHVLTTTNISSDAPVTDWNGDDYRVGVTVAAHVGGADHVYCPFIDTYETTGSDLAPGSESVVVTYTIDMPVRVKTRQAGNIVPFSGDSNIANTGMSINVIRTTDNVYS
jgi:hypothetical protein